MKRNRIELLFRPDGTEFSKPVVLYMPWEAIVAVEDLTLYGENGEEIEHV